MKPGPKPIPDSDRFWKFVIKTENCWIWIGGTDENGRGIFTPYKRKATRAYRFSWELVKGPIPKGLNICHNCDNPICVNPEHLFIGTQKDNLDDMVDKGRHNPISFPGDKNPNAKLTKEATLEIKNSIDIPSKDLAIKYKVHIETIRRIRRQQGWVTSGDIKKSYSRGISGNKNYNAVLNDDIVRIIRKSPKKNIELAKIYGVSATLIGLIRKHKAWKHVK
jgi:hypothetical protein